LEKLLTFFTVLFDITDLDLRILWDFGGLLLKIIGCLSKIIISSYSEWPCRFF
jgi:hypothetical protein